MIAHVSKVHLRIIGVVSSILMSSQNTEELSGNLNRWQEHRVTCIKSVKLLGLKVNWRESDQHKY